MNLKEALLLWTVPVVMVLATAAVLTSTFIKHYNNTTRTRVSLTTEERAKINSMIPSYCVTCGEKVNYLDLPKHRTYGRGDCPMIPPRISTDRGPRN